MNAQKKSCFAKISVVLVLVSLMMAALACNGENQDDTSMQETQVAIQLTQIALESESQGNQTGETGGENGSQPEPAPSTPTATTEVVQPTDPPDVNYEGISFSFDPAIASSVAPTTVQGQNLGEDFMPGETYPTHFEFAFNNYAVPNHFHTPLITVYPVADFQSISQYAANIIASLQSALVNRPGGGANSDLPFLPMWPAAQMFSAQVTYFDFQNGSGVRYLTMYGQALYPADNQNLFYTYQGLTNDGQYYISAVLPITNPILPDDGSTTVTDWEAFSNNWQTYVLDTIRILGEQPPNTYNPNIEKLDQMMASLLIDR
jgi:type II secretory pathway pseudopilin PulG